MDALQDKKTVDMVEYACGKFDEIRASIKELEALQDEYKAIIIKAMDEIGEDKQIIGDYKVSYSLGKREYMDNGRIKAELPDIWKEYHKETVYPLLTVRPMKRVSNG